MANTYTQIHIHCVFAVQNRVSLIRPEWKTDLYRYITGCLRNLNHKVLAINGMPDHVHILLGHRPAQSLSETMKIVKANSAKWINEKGYVKGRFQW
jgi:putative transposase